MVKQFRHKIVDLNDLIPARISSKYIFKGSFFLVLYCFLNTGCREEVQTVATTTYSYIEPQYDLVQLHNMADTISFPLNENTYNAIQSFNVFVQGGTEYMAFYDHRSGSVNIYNFHMQGLVKRILLRNCLPKELYRTTVYTKSFDSIFVSNRVNLYLLDSAGIVKKTIDLPKESYAAAVIFKNTHPPVFNGNRIYTGMRTSGKLTSLTALNKWKLLYGFDMESDNADLYYHLPELYLKNIYGYHFLNYSYCYNNRGNFVFSFPADTSIYETDLAGYHQAYYAKSHLQNGDIQPVKKEDIGSNQKIYKNYLAQDSYGAIYFDPYTKRYLRAVKNRISDADSLAENKKKKQLIIIFNEDFKIIGESEMDSKVSLKSIFFTQNGNIYARTNASDEYALHFVRLAYKEKQEDSSLFAQSQLVSH